MNKKHLFFYIFLILVIVICVFLIILLVKNRINVDDYTKNDITNNNNLNCEVKSLDDHYYFKNIEVFDGSDPFEVEATVDKNTHVLFLKKGSYTNKTKITLTNDEFDKISKVFDIMIADKGVSKDSSFGYSLGYDFSFLVNDSQDFCDNDKSCYKDIKDYDTNNDNKVTCREYALGSITSILNKLMSVKKFRQYSVRLDEKKSIETKNKNSKLFVVKQNNKNLYVKLDKYFEIKKEDYLDYYVLYYNLYINNKKIVKKKTMEYYIINNSDGNNNEKIKKFAAKHKKAIMLEDMTDISLILNRDDFTYFLIFKDGYFGYIRSDYYAWGNERYLLDVYNNHKLISEDIDVSTRIEMDFDGKEFKYYYDNCDKKSYSLFKISIKNNRVLNEKIKNYNTTFGNYEADSDDICYDSSKNKVKQNLKNLNIPGESEEVNGETTEIEETSDEPST